MISASISNETRKAVYRRDNYSCALCDSPRGLQVHHVMPRSEGGTNDPMNLITLCWRCHAVAHGTYFPETPDWMNAAELHEACIEYLADFYAPDWYPWEKGG
jgi:5-methylcytosine-specific restriction endonuclease McrA